MKITRSFFKSKIDKADKIRQSSILILCCVIVMTMTSCKSSSTTPPASPGGSGIGPNGGTVTSSDGKVSLAIPAGALNSTQNIAIVVSTDSNTCPQGIGAVYSLTPNGLTFSKPAALTLHFTDAMIVGSAASALVVASEDDTGAWWPASVSSADSAGHTITAQISHFSNWTITEKCVVKLSSAFVLTPGAGKDVELRCYCLVAQGGQPLKFVPNYVTKIDWSVNGITGGNSEVGTVENNSVTVGLSSYTAPASMPDPNQVNIIATATTIDGITFYVGEPLTLLAKNWKLQWNYYYGFVCGAQSTMNSFDYFGGGFANMECDENGAISMQEYTQYADQVANAAICPQFQSIYSGCAVTPGSPGNVTSAQGNYDQTSKSFIITVHGKNYDLPGFRLASVSGSQFDLIRKSDAGKAINDPLHFPSMLPLTQIEYVGDTVSGQYISFAWSLSPK